ncbi:DNA-binding transcriptional regulator, MarR family [Bhargavaea ginsengi]|uniref:DNA-binding transcriptional regulator, MarR family n=1 Tax=Bhargavaea ginsengi TaxID=426757 RepID=A0A1H7BAQ3_9BACL|nr:MarR family transcriptional regulator [Bhargavaea ginsengi]SEJ74518.1 DNA-binding transcriptional regulator, MarR family [Bhargavaea ginsengi]
MSDMRRLDLIDLLGERHFQLRRLAEERWNKRGDLPISNSEWFLMARIDGGEPTIAEVSRQVDITRQATHKLIRKMSEKGLVEVADDERNKKVKRVRLTGLGHECYRKNEQLKSELEEKIAEAIGADSVAALKEILAVDWELKKRES